MNAIVLPEDPHKLAVAVIAQAFFDLRDVIGGVQSSNSGDAPGVSERFEAVHFLTDIVGAWAEARTLWAELADLNPESIRDQAIAEINAPPRGRRRPVHLVTSTPHPDTRGSMARRERA